MSDNGQTSPNCNTYNTVGFHLGDLDYIRQRVREAIGYIGSHPEDTVFARNLLPWWFPCSHCKSYHEISIPEMHRALFDGPGAVDKMATMDEFKAIVERKLASAAGLGQKNAIARTAEMVLSDFFGEEEPVVEEKKDDNAGGKNAEPGSDKQV